MARIQILQLPPYGRDGETPFALIVDQCEPRGDGLTPAERFNRGLPVDSPVDFTYRWQEFGKQIGARSVVVTPDRVDIVDDTVDPDAALVEFDHAALTDSVVVALRAHLESPEASDAVRAWYERRMAAGQQPTEVHHHHHAEPRFDGTPMQEFVARSEARQRGGR